MKQSLATAALLSAFMALSGGCASSGTPAAAGNNAQSTDIDLLGGGGAGGFADAGATDTGTGDSGTVDTGASKPDTSAPKEFPAEFGWPCGGTGKCEADLKCFGNVESPSAICTAECAADSDCPVEFACTKSGKTSVCLPREFCSSCKTDAQCGAGGRCVGMGAASYCTRSCTFGKTDCPRYATCTEIGADDYVCIHSAGDCQGDGTLCAACAAEDTCGSGGACLSYLHTKEQFCSAPCDGTTCPATYKCVDVQTATGKSKQCVPGDSKSPKCVPKLHNYLEVGSIMQDFAITGYITNGDGLADTPMVIKLSEFAKNGYKIILLNAAAGWCGPCQQETMGFKSLAAKYPELGIYQILFDNVGQGQVPTISFLNQWTKALKPYGATGIDPERNIVPINTGGSTPLNMIIDAKTLKVLQKFNGAPSGGLGPVLAPYFK